MDVLVQLFKIVLAASLAGSAMTAVLFLLKPVTRKWFSSRWHYYMWLAVLTVMVLPVRFSILPSTTVEAPAVWQIERAAETAKIQTVEALQPPPGAETEEVVHNDLVLWWERAGQWTGSLAMVWLGGALVLLLLRLLQYGMFLRNIRKNTVCIPCPELAAFTAGNVTVRTGEGICSPLLTGICKPVLLLPERAMAPELLQYVLCHEMTHLKRKDIWYQWFAALVQCVHWFNPLIYMVNKQIQMDCEISCDLAVVSQMDQAQEKGYINTILTLLSDGKTKNVPLTTAMAGSKSKLKRRFIMMRNRKQTRKCAAVLSALTAAILLSTTVFASGILQSAAVQDNRIEITDHGKFLALENKPFLEAGEVYLPLRETFEKLGVMRHGDSYIHWDNGKIELRVAYETEGVTTKTEQNESGGSLSGSIVFRYWFGMEIGTPELVLNPASALPEGKKTAENKMKMANAPILKGAVTYVPFSYLDNMLDGGQWSLGYIVYGKDGKVAGINSYPQRYVFQTGDITTRASVDFYENSEFGFNYSMLSSYYPHGAFSLEGNKVICITADGSNTYVFEKRGTGLVFDKEQSSTLPEYANHLIDGAMFVLDEAYIQETGRRQSDTKTLTLDIVKQLAEKGNDLSWSDFAQYPAIETGSGLYILIYDIDENFFLMIGGSSMEEPPMYIRLVQRENLDAYIDIRTEDIDRFIAGEA